MILMPPNSVSKSYQIYLTMSMISRSSSSFRFRYACRVLKGKVLYEDDTTFIYDKAYETIKEFESFKRGYYDYLGIEPIT